jgi:hypothetical protein
MCMTVGPSIFSLQHNNDGPAIFTLEHGDGGCVGLSPTPTFMLNVVPLTVRNQHPQYVFSLVCRYI